MSCNRPEAVAAAAEPPPVESFEPNQKALVIEDTEFTNRPTTDRTHLVSIIKFLAKRVHDELKADMESNRRLARRLIISNRLAPEEATVDSNSEQIEEREQILVKLPYRVDTWNELGEDEIELEICKAVVNIHDEYAWFKVRVLLDQYIDLATRRLIDILEVKEDDPLAAEELERNIDSREPSISDLDEDMLLDESQDDARADLAQEDDVPEAVPVATKVEVIEDEPAVVAEIIEDDSEAADERAKGDEDTSDEDIMIVCEVPKPTPPKSKSKSKSKLAKANRDTVLTPTIAQIELINNRIKSLHTKQRS